MQNAKCAAIWPSEKLREIENAQQCAYWEKIEKCKMRSNARIGKKLRNAKCAAMWPSEKLREIENTQ